MTTEEQAKRWIERLGITDRSVDELRVTFHCDDLKLYSVQNTAGASYYILAEEPKLALVIALKQGIVRSSANGRVRELGDRFFANNPAFGSAVKRAMTEGMSGLVKRCDDYAIINGVEYPPLRVVK